MAIRIIDDAFFSWNGVDLSAFLTSVSVEYSADEVETTSMGDTTHEFMGGLKSWAISADFNNDEAASAVAQTFFADVGVQRTVIVRPDKSEVVSATNPNYTGTGLLVSAPPLTGGVGELSKMSIRIVSAGTLSRATA